VHVAWLPAQLGADCISGQLLDAGIDGRQDSTTSGGHLRTRNALACQLLEHPINDVRPVISGRTKRLTGLTQRKRRRVLLHRSIGRGKPTLLDHPVEHEIPSRLGRRQVACRIQLGWGLDQTSEQGCLGHGQVLHVLAEVSLAGGLDTVGTSAEVDGVEVILQDLILGFPLGDLGCDDHLAEFPQQAVLVVAGDHLDVLLRDRGAAATATGELITHCPGNRPYVESRVRPEAAILSRQHCVLHVHGDLRQADHDPVALIGYVPANLSLAITRDNRGDLLARCCQHRR
jgi:hypothetical protein